MPSLFPPGDTALTDRRSRWREQSLIYQELTTILNSPIGLRRLSKQWPIIRRRLANEPRKRQVVQLG